MLQVFNTFSDRLEPFEPLLPGKVQMYVCGPTVYDHPHIGHGRAYITYDVVSRYLRHCKFDVCYVRNITDIDDKIIKRAQEENISFSEVATKYTASFHEDMNTLKLIPPNHEPRASETLPEIITMISSLIEKTFAYESKGDVYFSIARFTSYGKLSKRKLDEMKAGARVEPGEQKHNPLDFALWKSAKPNEPFWPSPWGPGRPGWHIECSAMSEKLLGHSLDIHAGGRDLIFPHHENEIAQSEAAHGNTFVKYWLHNGFVNIDQEKMSKSLGNFVTLKELLAQFHPEALKLYLLSSHYRAPIDFADSTIREFAHGLDRIYRVLFAIPAEKIEPAHAWVLKFETAMDDDFNTPKALSVIFDLVKEANRLSAKAESMAEAKALRATVVYLGNLLGLLGEDPQRYFQNLPGKEGDREKIESLLVERATARRKKDFKRADEIRDEIIRLNIVVEDHPEGTTWRRNSN